MNDLQELKQKGNVTKKEMKGCKKKIRSLATECNQLFEQKQKKERIPFADPIQFKALQKTLESFGGIKLESRLLPSSVFHLTHPYNSNQWNSILIDIVKKIKKKKKKKMLKKKI